jgi:hypothetical protein
MKSITQQLSVCLLTATSVFAQGPMVAHRFVLFGDTSHAAIAAKRRHSAAVATERRIGNTLFQIFRSRSGAQGELFRVAVGWYRDNDPKDNFNQTWNYGIVDEGDFNGDGKPDYTWYGGDDTSEEEYLFLSTDDGYRRVDIVKSAQHAWEKKFKSDAPDFGEVFGNSKLDSIVLSRSPVGLVLNAVAKFDPQDYRKKSAVYSLRIVEADFIQ